MVIAYIPALVCLIGILMWALCSGALLREVGRWMYIIGLFVTVQATVGSTLHAGSVVIAPIPFVVCIVGLLIWAIPRPSGEEPPVGLMKQAGKIAFWVGLFWVVESLMNHTLKIG